MKTNTIYFLTLVLIFSSCGSTPEESASVETVNGTLSKEQMTAANIQIASLEKHLIKQTVQANGYLDVPPNQKAELHSLMDGFINDVRVIVGDKVKKGQTLAVVVSPEFIKLQQSYLELKSQLKTLEKDYQRSKTLADENITSQKEFLQAESSYLGAKARFESNSQYLSLLQVDMASLENGKITNNLIIRAPISGEITKVPVTLGMHIGSGNLLFQIVNTDHVHAELKVFEKDLDKVAVGQRVEMSFAQSPSSIKSGTIYQMSTILNENGRYALVHVHFEKEWANPLIGAYLEANIVTSSNEALAVKEEAIVKNGDRTSLYLATKQNDSFTFVLKEIKVGAMKEGWVEVLDLESGVQYVSKGAYYLTNR